MKLALSDGVSGTRGVTGGSRLQPRGRVVVRATAEGESSDALAGFLESLNSSVQSTPAPAPAPTPAPAPLPPPPIAATPAPAPPVVPSQPGLPSIESLAQKFEYPSSNAASVAAPAKAADVNPIQPLLDALNNAELAVENAFDDTAEAIIDNFNSLALPPSLQTKVDEITTEYADVKEAFDEAPEVYLFLLSLVVGAVGYAYYRNEYGGFSGIYKPTELVEALNKEDNVIVVDIRSDEEQEAQGVLDLRRSARGKAISLPIVDVPDAVKGDVRNSVILQRKLSAALVCSLANVNAFTKIVLMDTRGGTTKALAREISSQGYRAYCLKGGFTLWRRTGLSTKEGSYDVTTADLLADKGEELGEAATFTANELKKPQNAALVVLALISVGTTIAYPHESFQFFGFLGLQLTVILKVLSYENPSDAMAALNQSSRSFADSLGSAASSASSKLSSPAAAARAAVADAATKVVEKEDKTAPAPKAEAVKKPEAVPPVTSMFVKTSADKPATSKPASNAPAPSKPAPSKPASSTPTPSKPAPSKPASSTPASSTPAPSKPAPSTTAASTPAPSKPAPAAKTQTSVKKESSGDKKDQKGKWPSSVAAAAAEAAAIAQDVPKPVVEIVDKAGNGTKNGNTKGGVKSEKKA